MKRIFLTGCCCALVVAAVYTFLNPPETAPGVSRSETGDGEIIFNSDSDALADALNSTSLIAVNDFSQLLPATDAIRSDAIREAVILIRIGSWIQTDPVGTWHAVQDIEDAQQRYRMGATVVSLWGRETEESFTVYFSETQDEAEKRTLGKYYLDAVASRDPALATQWAAQNLWSLDSSSQISLLSRWATVDPLAAGNFILASEFDISKEAIKAVANESANLNLSDSVSWALQLNDPGRMDAAISGIVEAANITDASSAESLLAEFPAGRPFVSVLREIGFQLLINDSSEAITFIQNLPTLQANLVPSTAFKRWAREDSFLATQTFLRYEYFVQDESAARGLINGLVHSDPARALELLTTELTHVSRTLLTPVITAWILKDLPAVREFVMRIPDEEMHIRSLESFTELWGNLDAEAAGRWVLTIQNSKSRDIAIEQLMPFVDNISSTLTAAILNQLPEGALRADWLVATVRTYSPERALNPLGSFSWIVI